MQIEMLKSKLYGARVTHASLEYEGSLGIDAELMDAVGIYPFQKLLVANMANGNRFETYAITEAAGSRKIALNGAAAKLGAIGDRLIIMTFGQVHESKIRDGQYELRILRLDENNNPLDSTPIPDTEQITPMVRG